MGVLSWPDSILRATVMNEPNLHTIYSTQHGQQVVGDSRELLPRLPGQSIDLLFTSPPFALLRQKSYGNEEQADYVDWLVAFGRAALPKLKETGSFVVDLGGAYVRGRPVRSLYNYRVLLRFCDELGYRLAEEFFWHNPAKLPSPIEWVNKSGRFASKILLTRFGGSQKTTGRKQMSGKVLAPYSERMKTLLKDAKKFYTPKLRPSGHDISDSFDRDNGGAIPPEILPHSEHREHRRVSHALQGSRVRRTSGCIPRIIAEVFHRVPHRPLETWWLTSSLGRTLLDGLRRA